MINSLDDALSRMGKLSNMDREVSMILTVTPSMKLINEHVISAGGFYECIIPYQVLFKRILVDNAKGFILGHNHIDGNPRPSESDIAVIYKLMYVGEILNVKFIDSIIFLKDQEPISIKQSFPLVFNRRPMEKMDKVIDALIPKKFREE